MVMHGDIAWLPLAAIARSFGHEVVWHAQNRTVEIVTRTNRLFSEYVRAIAATGSLLVSGEIVALLGIDDEAPALEYVHELE